MCVLSWTGGFVAGCCLGLALAMVRWPGCKEIGSRMEDMVAASIVRVLEKPRVSEVLAAVIVRGLTAWVVDSQTQEALRVAFSTMPKSEAARELGKNLPSFMMDFSKGVVSGTFKKKKE